MKLVTYSHQGAQGVGVIASDPQKVVPVAALGFSAQDMNQFIRQLDGRSPTEFTAQADAAPGLPLSDCRLLAPIPRPQQDVVCLGVNYYEHRDETLASNIKYDGQLNKTIYFSKRVNRAVDPNGAIESHADLTSQLDYEVELAVILGRDAKNVPMDQVKDYVLGYTILNDVIAPHILQIRHLIRWLNAGGIELAELFNIVKNIIKICAKRFHFIARELQAT